MILKVKKILSLIPAGHSLEITADGVTFSDAQTRAYIRANFASQAFLFENDDDTETEQDVANCFYDIWLLFLDMYDDSLDKSMIALRTEYNPLENYDRTENEGETETKKPDGRTYTYNTTTTTTAGLYGDKTEVSTYDSGLKDERKSLRGHETNEHDTEAKTGSDSITDTFGDKTIERNSRVHGNIGVTTSQQMLAAELEIRKYNLFADYINRFIRTYCFTFWGCRE